jgi:hypothetical protein
LLKSAALLFCLCAALSFAGASSASPGLGSGPFTIGVTEDAAKGHNDGGLAMFTTMTGFSLTVDRMAVVWDPAQPTTIQEQASLARAITGATAGGVKIVLSIQPEHSTDVTGTGAYDAFAAYCVLVAKAFPQVQDLIIGNEPNLQLFNNPSWNGTQPVGAYNYEKMLATAYDALHAFNANLDVIGLATSPRGNVSNASSNVGIPPVIFIDGMGDAYKASARSTPIADNVSMHPYPNPNSADDPPEKGYQWPNAGVPNLDRLQQAWWDAFNGTGQPLFEEDGVHYTAAPKSFIKWILDEAGWQVPTTLAGYFNNENWKTVSEPVQAQYYAAITQRFACDPKRVASLLFFHWIDEKDRAGGFQSGFARIDGSIRDAAAAVKSAFAAGCPSAATVWQHMTGVSGASADFKSKNGFLFFMRTEEDVTYTAGVYKASGGSTTTPPAKGKKPKKPKNRRLAAVRLGAPIALANGTLKAYYQAGVKFPGKKLAAGTYVYSVTMKAAYNPARSVTFTSATFTRK